MVLIFGFGHRMLWTTPESLVEKLPCTDATGDLVITADARIDNRDELVLVLDLPNRPLETITDSEFILAAYRKWGESCPQHLLGDFAFAIWDKPGQSIFAARDHFGVKPFYYYHKTQKSFQFGSEIKALLSLEYVPRQPNQVKIADYLVSMFEDKTITSYEDILRLPPASSMIVGKSGVRIWSYWSLQLKPDLKLDSNEAYAEAFRDVFTQAVSCRLRSAFSIGSQLSGGLDSSAVTCVARKLLAETGNKELQTISLIFDQITECDERKYINAVLDQGGLQPHYIHGDKISPLSNLDSIFKYAEEAFIVPNHHITWGMNSTAQQAGARIVLTGLDGDNTVSHGIVKLTELASQGKWEEFLQEAKLVSQHFNTSPLALLYNFVIPHLSQLAKQLRWLQFAKIINQIHKHFNISRKHLLIEYGIRPTIIEPLQKFGQQLGIRKRVNNFAPLVNRKLAQRINLEKRIQTLQQPSNPTTVKEQHWLSLTTGIFQFSLEQLDLYAAAFSLEYRHPFMDKRLIEFCLSLPSEQKLNQGWSRVIMRRGLANILPETVQWRGGKADMTANILHGLLTLDRERLNNFIFQKLPRIEEYVDLKFVQSAYQRITSTDKPANVDVLSVWRAVSLLMWLEHTQVTL
jgi:asparagine synthase (glutamine-hydrolysing)